MKRTIIVLSIILGASLLVVGGYLWLSREPVPLKFSDQKTGLKLQYSPKLLSKPISEIDRKDNFFLRLENGPKEKTQLLIRASYEEGLTLLTTVTRSELIPLLMSNAQRRLSNTFPGLNIESTRQFEISTGQKAGEVIFTYDSPSKQRIKRRLFIIAKDNNTAIYIAAETTEKEFDGVNKVYFRPIIDSAHF